MRITIDITYVDASSQVNRSQWRASNYDDPLRGNSEGGQSSRVCDSTKTQKNKTKQNSSVFLKGYSSPAPAVASLTG